jgi:adenylyltransferase/sulfurtransferase
MSLNNHKLRNAKILIAGAGGLGSPAAMILAQSGICHLGIADYDRVELSNLQRQIIHSTASLGMNKTESAAARLKQLFPGLKLHLHPDKISEDSVREIISGYDIVVDGVDNFPARYLLNDACYFAKIPMVDGGVSQFEGQVTTFMPDEGPCLRCIFPIPPPPGLVPTCQEAGILGPVAGLIGSIQAWETLGLITKNQSTLVGKMWIINALTNSTRIIQWPRDPSCALCGDSPTITTLQEIEYSCDI